MTKGEILVTGRWEGLVRPLDTFHAIGPPLIRKSERLERLRVLLHLIVVHHCKPRDAHRGCVRNLDARGSCDSFFRRYVAR